MKMTLLEMTQSILTSMVSDSISSLSDGNEEALMVADIIKETYYEILARDEWDFLKKVEPLDAYGQVARPNFLVSPVPVNYLKNVRYNAKQASDTQERYKTIQYELPEEFLDRVLSRSSVDSNVSTVNTPEGVKLFIFNDRAPSTYTSFDDSILVFDSFDLGVDTTLQASKSVAITINIPAWESSDSFVPVLPAAMFPMLLSEAKVVAHQYIKQQGNPVDAKRSYRQGSMNKWNGQKVKDKSPRRGFGRRG